MKSRLKIRDSLVTIGLLVGLISTTLALFYVYALEKELDFQRHWMVVKKFRADEHQYRIEQLEKKVNGKVQLPTR